jgi:cytoskeletal protein RodZ
MDSPDQDKTESRRNEAGVGALLKASRLRVGGDLHQIADVLRIRYVYMEAIEDGRFAALPGPTYATGFIRAYAEHLGLDSQEVVRRFKNETAANRDAADLTFPEPIPESGVPGGAVIFVGILIAAVAYGAWYVNSSKNGFLVELISPLPERLAKLVEGDAKPKEKPAAPTPVAAPETKQEAKPEAAAEAKPEAPPATAAATQETKPETKPEPTPEPKPEAKPNAQPETAAAAASSPTPSPAPAAQPEAPPAQATPPASPVPAAEPQQTQEIRETPVATERPAPAPVEPLTAPTNVPVDMIPPPKPAATAAATPALGAPPAGPAQPSAQPAAASETPPAAAPATTPSSPPASAAPPAAAIAAAPADQTATPAAPAAGETKTRIVVRAKQNSWIQVRDEAANELLVTRLLRTGDSYAVPDRPGLRLSTGNAGALEILVDGAAVPAIGEEGAVRRNVRLDAGRLKAGQAVSE